MQSPAQVIENNQVREGLGITLEHAMTTDFPDTDRQEDQLQIENQMEQAKEREIYTEFIDDEI